MKEKYIDMLHVAMDGALEDKPDMQLTCLYCSKLYKPYNHMINHDYAFFGFCNEMCFSRYNSTYGALKRVYEEITRWIWHKPKYFIIDSYYNSKAPLCPECGAKLKHQCRFDDSNLFWCENNIDNDDYCWFQAEYKRTGGF